MQNGLVSIITPCYNKQYVVGRFLESVIAQTYRPIELIVVDDGSTDDSMHAILSFETKLLQAGIQFYFYHQENAGVGAAINSALKKVQGEYLCWPDIDDWLEPTSVEEKISFLMKNPSYAIVTTNASVYQETNLDVPVGLIADNNPIHFEEDQFIHLLKGQSIVCSGCHMVRTRELFDSIGGNQIFPSRYGQNLQLLFPILYHSKRGYIDKPLYNYVIYNNSLSHFEDDFEKNWKHRERRFQIKVETLKHIHDISAQDLEEAVRTITIQEARYRLNLASRFHKLNLAKEQIDWLRKNGELTKKDILLYMEIRDPFLKLCKNAFVQAKTAGYRIIKRFKMGLKTNRNENRQ